MYSLDAAVVQCLAHSSSARCSWVRFPTQVGLTHWPGLPSQLVKPTLVGKRSHGNPAMVTVGNPAYVA